MGRIVIYGDSMSAEAQNNPGLILPVRVRSNPRSETMQVDFDDGSHFDMLGNRMRGVDPPCYREVYWTPDHEPVDPPYHANISERLLTAEDIERGLHEQVVIVLGKAVRNF